MSKKLIKDYVWCGITDCTKLKEIKDVVDELIEKYGESAEVVFDAGYNNIDEKLYYFREESEVEYQKRLKLEAREREEVRGKKERQEEKERKEYERLKAKFGGNK